MNRTMANAVVLIFNLFMIWVFWQVIKYFARLIKYLIHPDDIPVQPTRPAIRTFRCPNCGAEARVRGDQWECGFCGDFGRLTYK